MALQAYDGSDALDVTVRSLKTARAMGGVRWIEGAAEQPDAHAARMRRQDDAVGFAVAGAMVCAITRPCIGRAHRRELAIHGF